ncbi:MAG: hypothetical protein ACK5ND_12085 [Bacteroides sp.]
MKLFITRFLIVFLGGFLGVIAYGLITGKIDQLDSDKFYGIVLGWMILSVAFICKVFYSKDKKIKELKNEIKELKNEKNVNSK